MGCSVHWLVDRDNSRLPLWWYGCINTLPLETGCRTKHLSSGSWGSGTVSDRWTASCRSGVTDRYRSFWLWRRNEQNSWLVSPSWSVCLVWRNISWKKNQMNLIIKLSKLHLTTFKTIHHLFLNLKMILNYTTRLQIVIFASPLVKEIKLVDSCLCQCSGIGMEITQFPHINLLLIDKFLFHGIHLTPRNSGFIQITFFM